MEAGNGSGGALGAFFRRFRTAIVSAGLSVVGIATGTATASAVLQDSSALGPAAMAAGVALAALCCAWQTRHAALAVLAAVAPLPGLILAAPMSGGPAFGFVPFLAYAVGFAAAALMAETSAVRVLDDSKREYPWLAAAAAVVLTAVLAGLWFWGTRPANAAFQAAVDLAAATVSAAVLVPLGASLLHFDESFVVRANRVRERRRRTGERLAFVTVPRWAFSLTGIALVFLALGWFGAAPLIGRPDGAVLLRLAGSVLLVGAAGWAVAGGWREAAAVVLVAATVALIALWGMALLPRGSFHMPGALEAAVFAAFLAFCGGRLALRFRQGGDAAAVARARAVEEGGSGLLFAGAGAALSTLPGLVLLQPGYAIYAAALLIAVPGGALFAPAVATAVEVLLPRRRSVEELYGKQSSEHRTF